MGLTKQQRTRQIKETLLSQNNKQCFFTVTDIMRMFGWKSDKPVKRLVKAMPKIDVNGKTMYFIGDLISAIGI